MGKTCNLESHGSCISHYSVTVLGMLLDLSFLIWKMGEPAAWGQEDTQTSASPQMLFHNPCCPSHVFQAMNPGCAVTQRNPPK